MTQKSCYILIVLVFFIAASSQAKVFLPGTQPEEFKTELNSPMQCKMCHGNTKNGNADPYFSWQSGMMSQAARDPLYLASLAIANQDIEEVGEYCWRCHTPQGWIQDRSTPADGSKLNQDDKHGVTCQLCHRLLDPKSDKAKKLVKDIPPGYGNAMMVVDPENIAYGPYSDSDGPMPHETMKSTFHASSDLCGTCHDVSNPLAAKDVKTQKPYEYGHIERTYSEWLLSDFAKGPDKQTCQSCHQQKVPQGGKPSRFSKNKKDYFVMHGAVGASTWVQDLIILQNPDSPDIDKDALKFGKQRALELLKTAAKLEFNFEANKAKLKITNLTGHKLPTGYPEGRRMWVNVKYYNADGKLISELGKYAPKKDTIFGKDVAVPTIIDPEATTVYECLPGLSDAQAKKHNKTPGKSFHFVLNDITVKDNRIPPKGFKNDAFKKHNAQPVAKQYPDGQYWDEIELTLPAGCADVQANLMYQSASWEYIKFLAEENKTNNAGKDLYELWQKTEHCPPTTIATIKSKVAR